MKKYVEAGALQLAYTGITVNVSEGGMLVETKDDSLSVGSQVTVSVCFDKDVIKIPSEILRLEHWKKGRTGVGLKFAHLPDTGLSSIRRLQ